VQEVLYERLNPLRRRRYHLRAGEAVEAAYGAGADGHLAELARHFTAGGHQEKGPAYRYRAEARYDHAARFEPALPFYVRYARALAALARRQQGPPAARRRCPAPRDATGALTPREREVAALLARGLTNREIAETLVVGERTAEMHVSNVLGKLGVRSRAQAAVWATERGLVIPGPSER
jgi:DNA-binding CsgD family transcriptional regulator